VLKLPDMAAGLRVQMQDVGTARKSFEERLFALLEAEFVARGNRRSDRLVRCARIGSRRSFPDVDFRARRGLDESWFRTLVNADWIRGAQKLLITGPAGIGKTFLSGVIGVEATRANLSVGYWRMTDLLEELAEAERIGTFRQTRTKIGRHHLVVIDNWLSHSLTSTQAHSLSRLVEHLHESSAILVESLYPVEQWYDRLGDPASTESIIDRLKSSAHRLVLSGASMRTRECPGAASSS
jgi:DNA replication protein DnaC